MVAAGHNIFKDDKDSSTPKSSGFLNLKRNTTTGVSPIVNKNSQLGSIGSKIGAWGLPDQFEKDLMTKGARTGSNFFSP